MLTARRGSETLKSKVVAAAGAGAGRRVSVDLKKPAATQAGPGASTEMKGETLDERYKRVTSDLLTASLNLISNKCTAGTIAEDKKSKINAATDLSELRNVAKAQVKPLITARSNVSDKTIAAFNKAYDEANALVKEMFKNAIDSGRKEKENEVEKAKLIAEYEVEKVRLTAENEALLKRNAEQKAALDVAVNSEQALKVSEQANLLRMKELSTELSASKEKNQTLSSESDVAKRKQQEDDLAKRKSEADIADLKKELTAALKMAKRSGKRSETLEQDKTQLENEVRNLRSLVSQKDAVIETFRKTQEQKAEADQAFLLQKLMSQTQMASGPTESSQVFPQTPSGKTIDMLRAFGAGTGGTVSVRRGSVPTLPSAAKYNGVPETPGAAKMASINHDYLTKSFNKFFTEQCNDIIKQANAMIELNSKNESLAMLVQEFLFEFIKLYANKTQVELPTTSAIVKHLLENSKYNALSFVCKESKEDEPRLQKLGEAAEGQKGIWTIVLQAYAKPPQGKAFLSGPPQYAHYFQGERGKEKMLLEAKLADERAKMTSLPSSSLKTATVRKA